MSAVALKKLYLNQLYLIILVLYSQGLNALILKIKSKVFVCLVYRAKVSEVVVFTEAPFGEFIVGRVELVRAYYENLYKFT